MDEIHALKLFAGAGLQRAALRGGNWNNGSNARSGFALNLNNPPSNANINIGFRAALPGKPEVETLRGFVQCAGKGTRFLVAPACLAGKKHKQVAGGK